MDILILTKRYFSKQLGFNFQMLFPILTAVTCHSLKESYLYTHFDRTNTNMSLFVALSMNPRTGKSRVINHVTDTYAAIEKFFRDRESLFKNPPHIEAVIPRAPCLCNLYFLEPIFHIEWFYYISFNSLFKSPGILQIVVL